MSKIALTPNASGTGTLTIAAPNTNTDRTLTLPDASGTVFTDAGGTVSGRTTFSSALNSASPAWDFRNVLFEDTSSFGQPSISFHAPQLSSAGIFKYTGNIAAFEFRSSSDTGFLPLHGGSMPTSTFTATGGNTADLSTAFEARLSHTFNHGATQRGRVCATLSGSISRGAGGANDFIAYGRLWNNTLNANVFDGPSAVVSDPGNYSLLGNAQWSVGFEYGGPLNVGQSYSLQLIIRKTNNVGPYFPVYMSIVGWIE